MKNGKMMRGFMCQSTAVNTACMAADPRSVVMPRRVDRLRVGDDDDDKRVINNARYSRLVGADKRPIITTSVRREQKQQQKPKKTLEKPVQLASSEHVFQVVIIMYSIMPIIFASIKHRYIRIHHLQKNQCLTNRSCKWLYNPFLWQVVVMRVAIHCQGCAGKVKKHLSKMEGVTSFSIDIETKRVTVMGHVSPVGVLESISKVKKAEFWPC
ncbi:hypothetical protein J1N35_015691 [Gossypium stocksii]|uniref:HMA domain-containing protein n=1 Tax=Gossypium stocksii TaxID=47602 RepID=A0A9D3VWP1_9ROSI|nr:hypothetical protein J1N35_015691 [Gossypium stocksii]